MVSHVNVVLFWVGSVIWCKFMSEHSCAHGNWWALLYRSQFSSSFGRPRLSTLRVALLDGRTSGFASGYLYVIWTYYPTLHSSYQQPGGGSGFPLDRSAKAAENY